MGSSSLTAMANFHTLVLGSMLRIYLGKATVVPGIKLHVSDMQGKRLVPALSFRPQVKHLDHGANSWPCYAHAPSYPAAHGQHRLHH